MIHCTSTSKPPSLTTPPPPIKMVAGKSSPAALALNTATKTPKLPPLRSLRVRRPNQTDSNPCLGIMSSMLGCWASNGQMARGCAVLEQQLRGCMDAKRPPANKRTNINATLAKFYPQIRGPVKKK